MNKQEKYFVCLFLYPTPYFHHRLGATRKKKEPYGNTICKARQTVGTDINKNCAQTDGTIIPHNPRLRTCHATLTAYSSTVCHSLLVTINKLFIKKRLNSFCIQRLLCNFVPLVGMVRKTHQPNKEKINNKLYNRNI